ncbi:MAG: chromate transporter [Bacteroidia bacterium]|nr:chromate transporter [Bacteroidia bacterium]
MIGILLQLFWTFFIIGAFTIGGGYAMLSLIQNQVVNVHGWISESMFTDIVAISQMTPGPIGINTATYVGYSVMHEAGAGQTLCVLGSFTATTAVVLPSVFIMMFIVKAYLRLRDSSVFQNTMAWLKPTVAGLIGAAALILITPENFTDWKSWCICMAAFAAAFWGKAHPILIIIASAVLGLVLY